MAIQVMCSCGATTVVNDEFIGRTGQCRTCKGQITVGQPSVEGTIPAPSAEPASRPMGFPDPLFGRDKFLLRQKHMAINEKYVVWDETGRALLFVERPAHLFRNVLALLGGIASGGAIFAMMGFTVQMLPETIQSSYVAAGILLAFVVIIMVYVRLEQKRHVEFYKDESKSSKVLRIIQDKKFEIISATYTVLDAAGKQIGTFRKNHLHNIIRKRWECHDHVGKLLFIAYEDSIIKSILRRLFGPLFGLLRLNFIFQDPQGKVNVGIFNRSFTILDRYVLDMSQDAGKRIDRRLAMAMGVMLDSGERR